MDTVIIKNFTVNGNEKSVENILSQLKFISKIKEGEKISVKNMSIFGTDIISRIHRTLEGESREDTFNLIKEVITKAIDSAYYYLEQTDSFQQNIAGIIFSALQDSKTGLENLIRTYEDDRMFISKLETLMATLDIKVKSGLRRK